MRNRLFAMAAGVAFLVAPACEAQTASKSQEKPVVVLTTSLGSIEIELYPDEAPVTVENFLAYVDAGFYDGTVFHRVIPDFMVQGGGMEPDLRPKKTRDAIKNEADNGLKNQPLTLAMARTGDKDSATAQFFINLKNNSFLDHGTRDFGYAVFAKVSDGMDVVEKIASVPTGSQGGHQNVPTTPVVLESAKRK
jgi:peptidyl-prolyl cis-trans isomerase A (cyclophilin A)